MTGSRLAVCNPAQEWAEGKVGHEQELDGARDIWSLRSVVATTSLDRGRYTDRVVHVVALCESRPFPWFPDRCIRLAGFPALSFPADNESSRSNVGSRSLQVF